MEQGGIFILSSCSAGKLGGGGKMWKRMASPALRGYSLNHCWGDGEKQSLEAFLCLLPRNILLDALSPALPPLVPVSEG